MYTSLLLFTLKPDTRNKDLKQYKTCSSKIASLANMKLEIDQVRGRCSISLPTALTSNVSISTNTALIPAVDFPFMGMAVILGNKIFSIQAKNESHVCIPSANKAVHE